MESGTFKMVFEDIQLREHVNEVVSIINVQISFKQNVKLVTMVSAGVPEMIEIDP